jgi:putative holliday junction resolvase
MSSEPGRVMALDVGGRRIGVAMSDPTRVLASPLTTLRAEPRPRVIGQIAELVVQHNVTEVVVGLPLTLSGEIGPQAKLVQAFVEELQAALAVPLHMFDERLTSVAADRLMQELGIKPERRRERIDEVAASIILQDFLDSRRGGTSTLPMI